MAKSVKKNDSRAAYLKFWSDHPNYTAFVHTTLGVGLGLLAQTFIAEGFVNMAGWGLVFAGVICMLYPLVG